MILVIDNYDSFVHNLARYVRLLGFSTTVRRAHELTVGCVDRLAPEAIVISPGPCSPTEAPSAVEIVARRGDRYPILGICLGHQVMVEALGGSIARAPQPVHGLASSIVHDGRGVFAGVPSPMAVGRYHSLVADIDSLPACIEIQARTRDGIAMAVRHRELPLVGLQFHPESVLTEHGSRLLDNFFRSVARLGSPPAGKGDSQQGESIPAAPV